MNVIEMELSTHIPVRGDISVPFILLGI